jgi:hypothetical protein
LVSIVFDTYLGDDVTDETNRVKHFKWAWNKNIDNFKLENIHFESTSEMYHYFLNFFIETFYSVSNKDDFPTLRPNMIKLWTYLFNNNVVKTRSDMDMLVEIYGLFSKSLEKSEKN